MTSSLTPTDLIQCRIPTAAQGCCLNSRHINAGVTDTDNTSEDDERVDIMCCGLMTVKVLTTYSQHKNMGTDGCHYAN